MGTIGALHWPDGLMRIMTAFGIGVGFMDSEADLGPLAGPVAFLPDSAA